MYFSSHKTLAQGVLLCLLDVHSHTLVKKVS